MKTITIDDRKAVVNLMLRNLKELLPGDTHEGYTHVEEMLEAFRNGSYDIAFLDIEMPEMNGMELAKKLQKIDPKINIIFITGYDEYMPEAFDIYASGYLLKPISHKSLQKALDHLRYEKKKKAVRVQCFGFFEVFVNDKPIRFHRKKSKELLAYLVDRKGTVCTNDMIIGNLWGDKQLTDSLKSMERTVIADMIKDCENAGTGELFFKQRSGIGINTKMIDCDYYDYLKDPIRNKNAFKGEYMSQYEFADETRNSLLNTLD